MTADRRTRNVPRWPDRRQHPFRSPWPVRARTKCEDCGIYYDRHPHPVVRLLPDPGQGTGRHNYLGRRCHCHGHCADCGQPVVVDKMGRLVHREGGTP